MRGRRRDVAGAVVGVAGAAGIRRARREALNDRLRDAFGDYLGALHPAVADLRELPDVDGLPVLDQAVNRLRGEKATFIASRRRERQIFGDGMPMAHTASASPSLAYGYCRYPASSRCGRCRERLPRATGRETDR